MKRVAVCLHGQLRHWEITSKIFSLWNLGDENIHFDFFLSTWDDNSFTELDIHLPLTKYSVHTHEEMYKTMTDPLKKYYRGMYEQNHTLPRYEHYYSFLVSKSVALLKESNVNYDAAILLRPDVFVYPVFFDFLSDKFNFNVKEEPSNTIAFSDKIVYTKGGSYYSQNNLFCGSDTMFIGSPNAIKTFGKIYHDIFENQFFPNYHLHKLQAEYLNWQRIYNQVNSSINHRLVKENFIAKNGAPTPEGLEELLNKIGSNLYTADIQGSLILDLFKKYS